MLTCNSSILALLRAGSMIDFTPNLTIGGWKQINTIILDAKASELVLSYMVGNHIQEARAKNTKKGLCELMSLLNK